MNTMVLNAVDQRIRSVRTANTSPKKVTRKGNKITQTTLFFSEMMMSVVEKIDL